MYHDFNRNDPILSTTASSSKTSINKALPSYHTANTNMSTDYPRKPATNTTTGRGTVLRSESSSMSNYATLSHQSYDNSNDDVHISDSPNIIHVRKSRTKIVLVIVFFLVSLVAFVCQTEATSYIYAPKFGFNEPYLLLYLTHGSWILLWPAQLVGVSLFKAFCSAREGSYRNSKGFKYNRLENGCPGNDDRNLEFTSSFMLNNNDSSINDDSGSSSRNNADMEIEEETVQITNNVPISKTWKSNFRNHFTKELQSIFFVSQVIYNHAKQLPHETSHLTEYESEHLNLWTFFKSKVNRYILKISFINTLIITIASLTWYVAMIYSYSNDVTAIYNCSAFFAYLFSIPLLKEKFNWTKLSSVIIAICGVFIVVYSGDSNEDDNDNDNDNQRKEKSYRFFGNILIAIGSISYGYYDVFYKKYLCPPLSSHHLINSKKQALYSNFICTLVGGSSSILLLILLFFLHITGIKPVRLGFSLEAWLFIIVSILSNLSYSASMLVLYALTSPVLGAVSSLTTIFLVGIFEWAVFGNKLSGSQLFGDAVVIIGFIVLSYAYWNEITEDEEN